MSRIVVCDLAMEWKLYREVHAKFYTDPRDDE
jgi:hypothetical protein